MRPFSLGKSERVRKNYEFRRIYNQGNKVVCRYFIVYWMKGGSDRRRLGVSVSKKLGNAVNRNRAKRIIREVFRLNRSLLGPGVDVIVVGRRGLEKQSFHSIELAMVEVMKKVEKGRLKVSCKETTFLETNTAGPSLNRS